MRLAEAGLQPGEGGGASEFSYAYDMTGGQWREGNAQLKNQEPSRTQTQPSQESGEPHPRANWLTGAGVSARVAA